MEVKPIDGKISKKEIDDIINKLMHKYQELIEEKRKLLGWNDYKVEDMCFYSNGFVFSQLVLSGMLNDLIDEIENIQIEIDDIKEEQKCGLYTECDEHDEVIERELLGYE